MYSKYVQGITKLPGTCTMYELYGIGSGIASGAGGHIPITWPDSDNFHLGDEKIWSNHHDAFEADVKARVKQYLESNFNDREVYPNRHKGGCVIMNLNSYHHTLEFKEELLKRGWMHVHTYKSGENHGRDIETFIRNIDTIVEEE